LYGYAAVVVVGEPAAAVVYSVCQKTLQSAIFNDYSVFFYSNLFHVTVFLKT